MKFNQKWLKVFLGLVCVSLSVESNLFAYVIFNRSSDPAEILSVLVFNNEKSVVEFFSQLGWTQKVEGVADKVGAAALFMPLPITALALPTTVVTKIAERAILDKYIVRQHYGLLTPAEKKHVLVGMSEDEALQTRTGAAWWWKDIAAKKGKSVDNLFMILVRVIPQAGGLPSIEGLFELLQLGAKFMKMDIVGSGYINRAAIVNYKGNNNFVSYLPFVEHKYAASVSKDGIPVKDIKWLTLEQGKAQNLKLYEYMTGCNLAKVEDTLLANDMVGNKPFDQGISLFFKNNTDRPLHAVFIEPINLSKLLEAGGWTKKTVEQLSDVTKKVVAVAADAAAASQGIPFQLSTLTNIHFAIWQYVVGNIHEKIVSAINVALLKPRDYFEAVMPGSLRYSYFAGSTPGQGIFRPATAIESQFKRSKALNKDLAVVVFQRDEKGMPDYTKIEFAGDFDREQFNGLVLGQDGSASLINFDPVESKITASVSCIGVSVELDKAKDSVTLSKDEKKTVEKAIKAVEKSSNPKVQEDVAAAKGLIKV